MDRGFYHDQPAAGDWHAQAGEGVGVKGLGADRGEQQIGAILDAYPGCVANPVAGLAGFDATQVTLPAFDADDFALMRDPAEVAAIAAAVTTPKIAITQSEIAQIVTFLNTLTDPVAISGRLGVPDAVPSGLQVPQVD